MVFEKYFNGNPNILGMKNTKLFKYIDSEESAYWLGFIVADGNINKNGHSLHINLSRRDKSHLQKLSNLLKQPVKDTVWQKDGKFYNGCYLCLSSSECWNDLYSLGVVPNKGVSDQSVILNNIPDDLKHHFLRGVFDGDGTVALPNPSNKNAYAVGFCGEKRMMLAISAYLREQLGIGDTLPSNPSDNFAVIRWVGKRQTEAICGFLYRDASIFLDRKKNRYNRIKSKKGKGKFFGVTKTSSGKWNASIRHEGKRVHIGNYNLSEEAARAHDSFAIAAGKPAYKINFQEVI